MKYRKLDVNGDYSFGFGKNDFLTDADAVTQAIQTKLLLFQGEWWQDITDGLPLFQQILGNGNIAAADLTIQARIMDAPNVKKIVSYSSSLNNRKYTASAVGDTIFGQVTVGV